MGLIETSLAIIPGAGIPYLVLIDDLDFFFYKVHEFRI